MLYRAFEEEYDMVLHSNLIQGDKDETKNE